MALPQTLINDIYKTYQENYELTVFFVWGHFLISQSDGDVSDEEVRDLVLTLEPLGIDGEDAAAALQEARHLFIRDRVGFESKLFDSARRFVSEADTSRRILLFRFFLDAIFSDEELELEEFAVLSLLGTCLELSESAQLYLTACETRRRYEPAD